MTQSATPDVARSDRSADFGDLGHLARRFAGSLWPGGPGVAGEAWARQWLAPTELPIWEAMSGPDRRHAVAVAHRAAELLGNADGAGIPRRVLAAALLHDAGKTEARLGPVRRSLVTVLGLVLGRRRLARLRHRGSGPLARAGRYAAHDEIGSDLLEAAGSDPLVVAWAREHHLPEQEWSVERPLAAALKAADDD